MKTDTVILSQVWGVRKSNHGVLGKAQGTSLGKYRVM